MKKHSVSVQIRQRTKGTQSIPASGKRTLSREKVAHAVGRRDWRSELYPENPLVLAIVQAPLKPSEYRKIENLVPQLNEEVGVALLWIQFVVRGLDYPIHRLSKSLLEAYKPEIFFGNSPEQAAKGAAMNLFERSHPETYRAYMEDVEEILTFDWRAFLAKRFARRYHACVPCGERDVFMVLTGHSSPSLSEDEDR